MSNVEVIEIAKAIKKKLGVARVWTPNGYMATKDAMDRIIAELEKQTNEQPV